MSDDDTSNPGVLSALSPTRRILRNSVAVFLLAFFLMTLLLSNRLGIAVAAGVAVSYALVQFLGARSCVACGLAVTRAPWAGRAVRCPSCGSECRSLWRSHT